MRLQFEDYKRKYAYLNGNKKMDITRMDLCRCVMQVGYKNRSFYTASSIYKRLQLFFTIMANIKENNGELLFKDSFYYLDQSEKVGVSYQIGQGLTKAVAEKYFNIPWVAHFSVMKGDGYQFNGGGTVKKTIIQNSKKGKEPDLIGYDRRGQVHLFEAKGTSRNKMSDDNVQKAINQVSNYNSITDNKGNIQNFITRNACFFTYNNGFQGEIIDPPPKDSDVDYRGNAMGYIQCIYNYYHDFLRLDKKLKTIHELGRTWCGYIFSINDKKVFWGIDSSYRNFLSEQFNKKSKNDIRKMDKENVKKEIFDFMGESRTIHKPDINDYISVGNDGYILLIINNR